MMQAVHAQARHDSKYWDGVGTLEQYACLKLASETEVTPIGHATNDRPFGIVQQITAKTTIPMDLIVEGPTLALCGGTVGRGKMVKTDATGRIVNATPTTDTEMIVGRARQSGENNSIVEIDFNPQLAAGS